MATSEAGAAGGGGRKLVFVLIRCCAMSMHKTVVQLEQKGKRFD